MENRRAHCRGQVLISARCGHWMHFYLNNRGKIMKFNRISRKAVCALIVAGSLAACGSDSKPETSAPAPADTTAVTEVPETTGGSTVDSAAAAAAAAVEKAFARPTQIEVTAPLGVPAPTGKTIDWVQCSIPACTQLGGALQDATDALGWTLNIIDGGITPETIANAWQLAVANNHDAVIGSGFPEVVFADSLKALEAAKIPVVLLNVTDEPGNGVIAVIQGTSAYGPNGALQADWVTTDSKGAANTLYVSTSAFPVVGLRADGFKAEYEKVCAGCTLDTLDALPTDFGDALNTQIIAYLQSHADVNYVVAAVSDMITGLNSALAGAGLSDQVRVMTNDINPALAEDLKADGPLKAATILENVNAMWQIADVLVRYFAGVDYSATANAPANGWIVTKATVDGFVDPYPLVEDYQAEYKALWGV